MDLFLPELNGGFLGRGVLPGSSSLIPPGLTESPHLLLSAGMTASAAGGSERLVFR